LDGGSNTPTTFTMPTSSRDNENSSGNANQPFLSR
jgi:hypothetical protein